MRRVIHSSKYVTGIHTSVPRNPARVSQSQAEHCVVHFAVRQQLVEQLRHMRQRDRPRITYFRRQRRFQYLAGVQPRQFLPLAIL